MALKLYCTMCAASLDADDLAIRRGIVTCQYCSTLLRITPKGTEAYQDEIEHRPPPPGIKVTHASPNQVSITVPRSKGMASVINKREVIKGAKIGTGLILALSGLIVLFGLALTLIGLPLGMALLPMACNVFLWGIIPAILISIFIVGAAQKTLPPFEIKDDIIYPSMMGSKKLHKNNVKQIYAAVAKLNTGQGEPVTSASIYALTENGKRVPLVGPVTDEEMALQLEEIIEVELGIFNLPVYGDADLPRQTDLSKVESTAVPEPIEDLVCDYCGIGLKETPEARKRGFIVCEHCTGLTLLYVPGSERPVLGLPEKNLADGQYRVEHKSQGLAIYPQKGDTTKPVLGVGKGKIHSARLGGSYRTIDLADVTLFQVREIPPDPDAKAELNLENVKNVVNFFGNLKDSMAYSGEVDPENMLLNAMGLTKYQLIVRLQDGRDFWLIKEIDDPREALFLVKTLEEFCKDE